MIFNKRSICNLLTLQRGKHKNILVHPRRFARHVKISSESLERVCLAQSLLPSNLQLVLTRGFESSGILRDSIRYFMRYLGAFLFKLLYPSRKDEVKEIFGSNGHDYDGNHIDVSVLKDDELLRFLPLSVFTPLSVASKQDHSETLDIVWRSLTTAGFSIHGNPGEARQIHCDLC